MSKSEDKRSYKEVLGGKPKLNQCGFLGANFLPKAVETVSRKEEAKPLISKNYTDKQYMDKICNRSKSSMLCNNRDLYNVLKSIAKKNNANLGIVLGIMSKESGFGTLWHKSNREDCKENTNNRGGLKANNTESGVKRTTEVGPGCRLQKFDTIEEGFTSQVRTIGISYKGCSSRSNPVVCISYKYVGKPNVSEKDRVNHVSSRY